MTLWESCGGLSELLTSKLLHWCKRHQTKPMTKVSQILLGSVITLGSLFVPIGEAKAYVTCNSIGNYTSCSGYDNNGNYTSGSANTIGGTTFYNGYNSNGNSFSGSCSSYGCNGYSY